MAYTDIRLLKLYNNKPAKPVLSLYTDDIKGMDLSNRRKTNLHHSGQRSRVTRQVHELDSQASRVKQHDQTSVL
jgi:hypothetical protein